MQKTKKILELIISCIVLWCNTYIVVGMTTIKELEIQGSFFILLFIIGYTIFYFLSIYFMVYLINHIWKQIH